MEPDKSEEFFGVHLGAIAPRGERGVLILNLDALLRVSSNPFFPYLLERIDQAIAAPVRARDAALFWRRHGRPVLQPSST